MSKKSKKKRVQCRVCRAGGAVLIPLRDEVDTMMIRYVSLAQLRLAGVKPPPGHKLEVSYYDCWLNAQHLNEAGRAELSYLWHTLCGWDRSN